jgi:hypothetical protein
MPFFLLGYAVAGRAFAYLGIPPFYMGEILLMIGLWQVASLARPLSVFLLPQMWFLLSFMLWGAFQTVPYILEYGEMALRDSAIWGYGFFGVIIAMVLLSQPLALSLLLNRYRFFVHFFPFVACAGLIVLTFFKRSIFDVTILLQMKAGDILVHLAAITAFVACGMAGKKTLLWFFAIIGAVICAGSIGRGGLLAFCFGLGVLVLLRIRYKTIWRMLLMIFVAILLLVTLIFIIPDKQITNRFERQISPIQLAKNMVSIFMPAEQWGLEGTKRYRLEWWNKIIDYTFFGDYFLMGKGYGINLAVSDDQVLKGDTSLRSPHNAHLTILARSGVTGLILWVILNLVWLIGMVRAIFLAKQSHAQQWEGWLSTLLVFYLAALVNASFDVYLEGPMGGIWFWTVFGIGMASIHLLRTQPELLENETTSNT